MQEETNGVGVVAAPPPVPTPAPVPPPKEPLKPQVLGDTFNITLNGEQVGQLAFDEDYKLMRGTVRPLRRKLCRKMGLEKRILDVVVLSVMNRYTKSDHFFGSFEFCGRKWGFTEVKFDTTPVKKTA